MSRELHKYQIKKNKDELRIVMFIFVIIAYDRCV